MTVSKFYPFPSTPTKGSKVNCLNFAVTKAVVKSFAEILHAGKTAIDMKHIKQDLNLKAWVRAPGGFSGWSRGQFFPLYVHVAYQIKADNVCSNMAANILPTDTLLTQGVGPKGQTIFFVKVVMLHIKFKVIEHRAP